MSGSVELPFVQGAIYLAQLNPAKGAEIGKNRPVVVLTNQTLLDVHPPVIFICPLSSQSYPQLSSLHVEISARERLQKHSFALVEHCRSIASSRLSNERLGHLTAAELRELRRRLGVVLSV